jgi:hypothetical protein
MEDCPRRAMAAEYISAGGARVKSRNIESDPMDSTVVERLLSFEQGETFASQTDAATLRQLLKESPAKLGVPFAVRGTRVVVASDPSRIQNLMY